MFDFGKCEECNKKAPIVNKKYKLCNNCNRKRLNSSNISPQLKKTRNEDEEIYEQLWNSKAHYCEECNTFLGVLFRDSSGYIVDRFRYSHILTKQSHPKLRHLLDNFNLLCLKCHTRWEFGDRENMKIFKINNLIIPFLLEKEKE